MSEQEQIDKLNAKVQQLLEEKRKVKAERDELQQQLEAVTTERDQAKAEVQRITVDLPRGEILSDAAVAGMGETLGRELMHHFEIIRTDDGTDLFHKDGQPVMVDDEPVPFTVEGINRLHDTGLAKLGSLLKGSQASGGNAQGSKGGGNASAQPKPAAPRPQFGMR
jgi:hypothetical protein